MDVVTVDGVKYEKASVVAKRFKYTSDYIGQLCRSRKIDAQLVGRSWYVNPLSIEAHKGEVKKDKRDKSSEITNKIKKKETKSRLDVEATINKHTARMLRDKTDWGKEIKKTSSQISYKNDETDLYPVLSVNKKNAPNDEDLNKTLQNTTEAKVVVSEVSEAGFDNSDSADKIAVAIKTNPDDEEMVDISFSTEETGFDSEVKEISKTKTTKETFFYKKLIITILILVEIVVLLSIVFLSVNITATAENFHFVYDFSFDKNSLQIINILP